MPLCPQLTPERPAWRAFAGGLAAFLLAVSPAYADKALPGPIPAEVIRVVDGDTIRVRARIWVDQTVEVSVRLAAIDAPEVYRPRCEAERTSARAARDAIGLVPGDAVALHDIRLGKYAGRVVADAVLNDGESLSARLLAQGHAVPLGTDKPWCRAGDRLAPAAP